MCELLGMCANVPTDLCFSFAGLMQRGGGSGPHCDGWGMAFYEEDQVRTLHDPTPCVNSRFARIFREHPLRSRVIISHIRQANVGGVSLMNTHPFCRALWGETWTFAHNGQLKHPERLVLRDRQPVGTTDSERAFCWLLDRLEAMFPERPVQEAPLQDALLALCGELREMGVFNLLLARPDRLYAYCSTKLAWLTRRAPFGAAHLKDEDLKVDFSEVTTDRDVVSVIATEPLTENEAWTRMSVGEMVVFHQGNPLRSGCLDVAI